MTTVSALAATLFFGGRHAPWPPNMRASATGWQATDLVHR